MQIYFARPENVAGTILDQRLLSAIQNDYRLKRCDIIAPTLPNDPLSLYGDETHHKLVKQAKDCEILVILPFPDGKIHFRHSEKLQIHRSENVMVGEISPSGEIKIHKSHQALRERYLNRSETIKRIWSPFRYMIPYQ